MAYEEETKRAEEQEAAGVAPVVDDRPVVEDGNTSAVEEPVNEVNSNTAAQVDSFQGKDEE